MKRRREVRHLPELIQPGIGRAGIQTWNASPRGPGPETSQCSYNLDSDSPGASTSYLLSRQMASMWVPRPQLNLERDTNKDPIPEAQFQHPPPTHIHTVPEGRECPRVLGKNQQLLELTLEPHCRTCPELINSSALEPGAECNEGHRGLGSFPSLAS